MAEGFKPIESQEAFDEAIKSRLERNTRTVTEEVTKKFEGYVSPEDFEKNKESFNSQISELNSKLKERDTKITDLTSECKKHELHSEKMRIANEVGIPFELAERLAGETAEELKADAEKLARFTHKGQGTPNYNGEKNPPNTTKAAYMDMLSNLKK